mgnify:CR=1 FL=1
MEKIGNLKREQKVFKSRVVFSSVIMLLMTLILIFRLFNLQITKHAYYVEEALGNQMQNLPITPIRGDIFDRNGKILATNKFSYRLTITPEKVTNLNDTLIELEINEYINSKDIENFIKNLSSRDNIKGEIIIVIEGEVKKDKPQNLEAILGDALKSMSLSDAAKEISKYTNFSKKEVYNAALDLKGRKNES